MGWVVRWPVRHVPGFNYTVANSSGGISGVLSMLSSESLVNVISSPSVMVLDNSTATIQVGDQVPILTGLLLPTVVILFRVLNTGIRVFS